jgi:hypothetical protein
LRYKLALDAIPGLLVDYRGVQTVVYLALMAKSSDVDRVGEDPVDVATRHKAAARRSTCPTDPNRRANVFGIKSGLKPHHATYLKVAPEKVANELGVFLHDVKGAIFHPISEWDCPAHPDASLLGGGDFVPDARR